MLTTLSVVVLTNSDPDANVGVRPAFSSFRVAMTLDRSHGAEGSERGDSL